MNKGFWAKLNKPIMALAPMADVTDPAFRRVIAKYGMPDVMWTEFVSADGLFLGGYERLVRDLEYSESERPIVAQLFTADPENMRKAGKLAVDLGFDGFDINMGCPDRSIIKQGSGCGMIKDPENAKAVIRAAWEGTEGKIPVSVKTRTGFNKNELDTWLPALIEEKPVAITMHTRTKKEMSKVPADWNQIKRCVEIRDSLGSDALIIGNGDVDSVEDGKKKCEETGADGAMLGRAIFGNPWLFSNPLHEPSIEEKLLVMLEHTKLFDELLGDIKNFAIMKKHYKAYVTGWKGSKELRTELMDAKDVSEVENVVNNYLERHKKAL